MQIKVLAVLHYHKYVRPADKWLTGNGWWRVSDENANDIEFVIQHDGEKITEVGRVVGWVRSAQRHIAQDPQLDGRKQFNCDPNVPVFVEALIGMPWKGNRNPVQILCIEGDYETMGGRVSQVSKG